jgi:hypothetical protein
MHDGALDTLQGFEGALDQFRARLSQYLYGDVVRNRFSSIR